MTKDRFFEIADECNIPTETAQKLLDNMPEVINFEGLTEEKVRRLFTAADNDSCDHDGKCVEEISNKLVETLFWLCPKPMMDELKARETHKMPTPELLREIAHKHNVNEVEYQIARMLGMVILSMELGPEAFNSIMTGIDAVSNKFLDKYGPEGIKRLRGKTIINHPGNNTVH